MKSGVGFLGALLVGGLVVAVADARPAKAASSALHGVVTVTEHGALAPSFATSVASATSAPTTEIEAAAPDETPVNHAAVTGAELVTPPNPIPYLENRKLRRLQKKETSLAMRQAAAAIVRKYHAKPVGTQVEVDIEGTHVVARIERHFHPEGGPVKPWGFHPGVSLFVYR